VLISASSLEKITDVTAEPAVEDGAPMNIADQMPGPSASPLIYRSTLGNVGPGDYLVRPGESLAMLCSTPGAEPCLEEQLWGTIPVKTFHDAEMAVRGEDDKTTRNSATNASKRVCL
jgi:hypothetical protein